MLNVLTKKEEDHLQEYVYYYLTVLGKTICEMKFEQKFYICV